MDEATPWEPPLAGSETEQLIGSLNRLRTTFRWKADGLDDDRLGRQTGPSALTIGGLLKHLSCCEDELFGNKLSGAAYGAPWAGMRAYDGPPEDYSFETAGISAAELYAGWDDAVRLAQERLDAALATDGLDQHVELGRQHGTEMSLRRLLLDAIEEYGRHTGHADLIREAIDGRVGEDPPAGWAAESGDSPVGMRVNV